MMRASSRVIFRPAVTATADIVIYRFLSSAFNRSRPLSVRSYHQARVARHFLNKRSDRMRDLAIDTPEFSPIN